MSEAETRFADNPVCLLILVVRRYKWIRNPHFSSLMKRKVFIAIAAAIISAFASVSSAQPKTSLSTTQPSKSLPALSEEQIKNLIQSETEKKDALRGQAEAEGKFNFTMLWVQVLLGGVSALLAFIPFLFVLIGYILWACRKAILGQLNMEAIEEVGRRVEEHLKITIDTEVKAQILNQLVQEFKAAVPASTQETPSPEKLSQIEELRGRIEDLQDLMPTIMMQSAEYYFKQGNAFYFEKQYEEAIASYDKALAFNSDNSNACTNRGVVSDALKRHEEAISSHNKALKLKPDDSNAWFNRACSYALQGKIEETVHDLKKAIELDSIYQEQAKTDSDFDKVRHDERFQNLL